MQEQQGFDERVVSRRRLLGKASVTVAGVAGAGVVGAVAAGTPAQAATGGNLVLGQANTADTSSTGLTTANSASATLAVGNTATSVDTYGNTVAGAPLQFTPAGDYVVGPPGSIGAAKDGTFYVVAKENFADYVYTSFTSNTLVTVVPQRVFDTRTPALRKNILNASSVLDGNGRVKAGSTLQVSLADYVYYGYAVFGNLTVTQTVDGGYATVFPYGTTRPASSTIDYAGGGSTLANGFVVGIGEDVPNNRTDVISIFVYSTTHLILDVTALSVGATGQVNPAIIGRGASAASRSERAMRARTGTNKPHWATVTK